MKSSVPTCWAGKRRRRLCPRRRLGSGYRKGNPLKGAWPRRGGCVPRRCVPNSPARYRKPGEQDLNQEEISQLFTARGTELSELCRIADELRQEVTGDERVTYVVNRNINYTNLCYFRCRFCAFSKGPKSLNLRGRPVPARHHGG